VILFVTLPVASHMLARAAARRQFSHDEIDRAPLNPRR
jgi:multisubunit Na+/H+ antiporter MnhG subunit